MSVQVALPQLGKLTIRQRFEGALAIGAARVLTHGSSLSRVRRTLTLLRRRSRPASVAEAEEAYRIVTGVSLRCAGPACLQRSVAVVLLCRLRCAWPTWCVGVRTPPFEAHAWVEAEGRPVGELEPLYRSYTTILAVRPPEGAPADDHRQ